MLIEFILAGSLEAQDKVCFRNHAPKPITIIVEAIIPWGDSAGPREILYVEPNHEHCLPSDGYFFAVVPGDESFGEHPIAWPHVLPNCGEAGGSAIVTVTGVFGDYHCTVVTSHPSTSASH